MQKKLKNIRINNKKIFVKPFNIDNVSIGRYGTMIFFYLIEELPEKFEEMKKAKTLIPYLKTMENKIEDKVKKTINKLDTPYDQFGFIARSQLLTQIKLETEEAIFNDLFPISLNDLP